MELLVAGVDTLRRERKIEILIEPRSGLFEHRQQHLVSCSGIGSRFQYYELRGMQVCRYLFGSRQDVRYIRLLRLSEWRRHAYDYGVYFGKLAVLTRCG